MDAVIVGAGEMGSWFAETLPADTSLGFIDADESAAGTAATAHGGQVLSPDTDERANLVCIAVPMPAVEDVITRYAGLADRAVVDLSGTMTGPVRAMRAAAPDCERLSLHPLFAPANAPGNVAIVAENEGKMAARIREQLRAKGCQLVDTTPEEHDEAMETVQVKTHAAILAYALAAEPVRAGFHTPISTGIDELAAGVLDGSPHVYADIQATFDGADDVARAARTVAEADREDFVKLYREASERSRDRQ